MTAFQVDIPGDYVVRYDSTVLALADNLAREWCDRNGGEMFFAQLQDWDIYRVWGRGVPSETITMFAAIAQGHPLHDIIAKLEELISD